MEPRLQWVAGVACILLVSVIWTFATVLKQIVFNDLKFDEPLVFSWVCNACYMVHLPVHYLLCRLGLKTTVPWSRQSAGRADGVADITDNASSLATFGVTAKDAFRAGLVMSPIWFAAQWTYSAGVARTSVTSSTVISATSVVWTLIASVLFAGEKLNWMKALGVAACFAGNIATQLGDMQGGSGSQAVGDLLCLASALCYASYTIVLKRFATNETSLALMFGALGTAIFVGAVPLVLIFGRSGLQNMTPTVFALLIFNGIFDNVVSQFAWAKAVQWTSPTAATVGLSLTIPLSIVADFLRRHPPSVWSFIAGFLVVLGFITVTLSTKPADERSVDSGSGTDESVETTSGSSQGTSASLRVEARAGGDKEHQVRSHRSAGTADLC